MLVDDWLELDATDYRCRECGYDPAGDDDDELWEVLNDIDTAPSDVQKAKTAEDVPLTLWEDDRGPHCSHFSQSERSVATSSSSPFELA